MRLSDEKFSRKITMRIILIIGVILFAVVLCLLIMSIIMHKEESHILQKPNIVVILSDDLGSHDLSLKGNNQILTPNIDALGYQGIILKHHYTSAMCTPSRAAFLTGKYPIHTGMQHSVILQSEPRGLPLNEKILPEYLKEAGYKTHIVGKWHLGFARKSFTPTHRGFDSHVGYLGCYLDYFDCTYMTDFRPIAPGFDFRHNESLYRDRVGEYLPDVLTDEASKIILNHDSSEGPIFLMMSQIAPHAATPREPFQTIPEDFEMMGHIQNPKRRSYAAMVRALDRSVGQIVKTLEKKDILDNTIIVFFSDNGGPTIGIHHTTASNYPLKGQKDSPWEGGLRGTALVWSPLLRQRHYVSDHLTHITDWLPTFVHLAGVVHNKSEKLDGHNIWSTLSNNQPAIRTEILHNIDPIIGYSSYYRDGWKYVNGTTSNGIHDTWLGDMPQENSPESLNYSQLVMNSDVWLALNPFSLKNLQTTDLEKLISQTKIECGQRIQNSTNCYPLKAPCLFYLKEDPCEMSNIAHLEPNTMKDIEKRLNELQDSAVTPGNVPVDLNADPALNNFLWTWWLDK